MRKWFMNLGDMKWQRAAGTKVILEFLTCFMLRLQVKMYLISTGTPWPIITEGIRTSGCLVWQMLFAKCCIAGIWSLACWTGDPENSDVWSQWWLLKALLRSRPASRMEPFMQEAGGIQQQCQPRSGTVELFERHWLKLRAHKWESTASSVSAN